MAEENKTEKATPKRRREQRKEGRVAQSTDVVMVGSLFIVFWGLKILGPYGFNILKRYYIKIMEALNSLSRTGIANKSELAVDALSVFAIVVLPISLLAAASAVILTGVQTKFLFSKKAFAFKLSNINILNGIKNLFSLKSIVKLLVTILKLLIVGTLLYKNYINTAENFAKLMHTELYKSVVFLVKELIRVAFNLCLALVGMAAVDYFYNWWSFEKSIKMTKQEVKDEYKQLEGDPQIRSQIRRKQRQVAQSRMMQMVPKADVVIRNPTHVAVALKYTAGKDTAPKVIAKGLDNIALKIVKIAEQNNVPVLEDRALARELYSKVKLGRMIPASTFRAVAEVLVWVYKLQKDKKERN
ncbi:MAG: flagellar biosynthesis protein FlhB [Oscillospiraceae bacterium]|nr:flagellar biosynthesis protein FlhB [Oscillospiraceae bacterium]